MSTITFKQVNHVRVWNRGHLFGGGGGGGAKAIQAQQ